MLDKSYFEYLNFANLLADASGAILSTSFKDPLNIGKKSDQSPVTQADMDVERRIRQLILKQFPTHGIIGEELDNAPSGSLFQWIIDPIDGTKSFIAGYPTFTTLIALLYDKKPAIGIINQPILFKRWAAVAGEKTLFNKEPLSQLSGDISLENARIATTSTEHFTPEQAQKFARLKAVAASTILGGDAYAYAMLASGRLDIVVDAGMKPYDFCALTPIIEGVGGIITDWQGKPLTIDSDGSVIACKNNLLHKRALAFL